MKTRRVASILSACWCLAPLSPATQAAAGTVSATNYWPDFIPVASPIWDVSSWRLQIGYLDNGSMQVREGAAVASAGGTIGTFDNDGDVLVDGQNSVWGNTNSIDMVKAEVSSANFGGMATLVVSNGGVVNTPGPFSAAANAGSMADIVITGTDARLTSEYFAAGDRGQATVKISAGGVLSTFGGVVGNGPSTVLSTVEISGEDSGWTATGAATPVSVGRGWGTLDILAGGALQAGEVRIGDPTIVNANDPAPRGVLTVSGAGSTLGVIGGPISVGYNGLSLLATQAELKIQNGAVAHSNGGTIGRSNGAHGVATVEGAGSAWNVANNLFIGANGAGLDGGQGELTIRNGGHVTVGGSILMGDQFGASGELHLDAGGTLTVGLLNLNAGTFDFTGGTLEATHVVGDLVNNLGTFSPGASPAIASVGSYHQGPAGTLRIELGGTTPGTQHDRLEVAGLLALGGTLDVVLIDTPGGGPFTPGAGDAFDILDWGSRTGAFNAVHLPGLTGGLTWDTTQLYATGVLSVALGGLTGDYNDSGLVEQGDLDLVLSNWGAAFSAVPAGWVNQRPTSGIVDQAELDGVLANWGASAAPGFRGTDVPEPAAGVAAAGVLLGVTRPRGSRRRR